MYYSNIEILLKIYSRFTPHFTPFLPHPGGHEWGNKYSDTLQTIYILMQCKDINNLVHFCWDWGIIEILLPLTLFLPHFTLFWGHNGVKYARTHYKLYIFWFSVTRQVIWYILCWDWDIVEILPPSTLFLPRFYPILPSKKFVRHFGEGHPS